MTTPPAPRWPPGPDQPEPPPRQARRFRGSRAFGTAAVLVVVAMLGVAGLVVLGISRIAGEPRDPWEMSGLPAPAAVRPGAAAPAVPGVGPAQQEALREWADGLAATVAVPARALRAYGAADLAMRVSTPGCRVNWATLAGIGRIESNHGRFGGAVLGGDGRPSRPIIGVQLDGSPGRATIGDTDGGQLDGDAAFDRAVGPMQFIPSTWARWSADGDGDGSTDPHDIDDAAITAARYLCADRRDIGTPQGWWAAVLSYNRSVEYGQRVFAAADGYARRSIR